MNNDPFYIDPIQLYFGKDYVINDKIVIHHPTIRDIVGMGEKDYYSMVHTITAIPSDLKSQLWDMGLDWEEVDDFDLFMMLSRSLTVDKTSVLFGDLDFSALKVYKNPENDEPMLANKLTGVKIDKRIHKMITNYVCKVHGITPKVEHAKNKTTKRVLIELDRQQIAMNANKEYKSFLLPLISSVKCMMGYTKDYILNEGLSEFMDDVSRLQIIYNADHLLAGAYAGTIDMKKINKKELNWLREIS